VDEILQEKNKLFAEVDNFVLAEEDLSKKSSTRSTASNFSHYESKKQTTRTKHHRKVKSHNPSTSVPRMRSGLPKQRTRYVHQKETDAILPHPDTLPDIDVTFFDTSPLGSSDAR